MSTIREKFEKEILNNMSDIAAIACEEIHKAEIDNVLYLLKEEFLLNTQNYPKEYHNLFNEKFIRFRNKYNEYLTQLNNER